MPMIDKTAAEEEEKVGGGGGSESKDVRCFEKKLPTCATFWGGRSAAEGSDTGGVDMVPTAPYIPCLCPSSP
jgi:hypothetical protein